MYDHLRTNPGSAGSTDMITATGIYRNQFIDFGEGAPKSFYFEVDAPFKLLGMQHGVGVTAYNDVIGFYNNTNPAITYALRINMGDGTLGIGIQAGVMQSKINPNWVFPNGGSNTDEYIPTGDAEGMPLTLAAGLFYRKEDIYFGASVINLNNPTINSPGQNANQTATYNLSRQYYVTAGYNMQLSNPVYELKPAVLLKSDGVATDMDINLTLAYNKKFWGGVSYRTGSAIIGLVGLELIENLKVGISYDFATSALSKESSGTIEVLMSYSFKIGVEKAPQKYKSIRFL
jgi:type IX secretion system PorP/SprF family membrane protein